MVRGITSAYGQICSQASSKSLGFFNLSCFQNTQPLETYSRSEQIKPFGDHQDHPLQQGEWVTSIDFKDTYFHIPIQEQSRKYLRFHVQDQTYQFKALPFGLFTASMEFHCSSKGVETDGHTQGYKNLPVPRRLVGESQIPPGLSPEYSRSSENMPRTRLAGELGEIGTGTQASLRLCS